MTQECKINWQYYDKKTHKMFRMWLVYKNKIKVIRIILALYLYILRNVNLFIK